jgi:hypothetical protein
VIQRTALILMGMLAALGVTSALVLGRHPLARYAIHEAIQQDVAAVRCWTFGE